MAQSRDRMTAADLAADGDTAQRRALRRHRMVATGLLIVMATVLFATRLVEDPEYWVRLIRAGAEAALVGGLADWFAVTALFRHPLGLPIPHTAIVARNKDRVGEGLGRFVERNFLAPDLVARKVRSLDVAALLGGWLGERRNAEVVAERIAATLPQIIDSLQDQEIREFVRRALDQQLRGIDLAPALGKVLAVLAAGGHHQALFDRILVMARELLVRHEDRIYEIVGRRSSWWVPRSVDLRVARAIVAGAHELLDEMSAPDHEIRAQIDSAAADMTEKLRHSPEYAAKIRALRDQILASPAAQESLRLVWDEVRRLVLDDVAAPESATRRALAGGLQALGRALVEDRKMRRRVNRFAERFVMRVVVPWRAEIGAFIAEVVRGWDARTVSDRMELAVGRDLQFIRMNGTLVGALVGGLLFILSEWLF